MEAVIICLLLGSGIYFSVKTRFVQVRSFFPALRSALPEKSNNPGVSSFEAGCTALAATIGTGNIAGVTGAILIAGPGVLFWMWGSAFLGMAVKYSEILFALRYRVRQPDGAFLGGPMTSIERGLGPDYKPLAILWAIVCLLSSFGMGCIVQVRTVIGSVEALYSSLDKVSFALLPELTAFFIALSVTLSLLGGAKRVGRIASCLVPVMSIAYLLGAGIVIFCHASRLLPALSSIFIGAFEPHTMGFSFFYVAATGLARGTFTHESGLGTSALAHSSAEVARPRRQALFGIFEVFLDTIVMCTVTGIAVLVSGISLPPDLDASQAVTNAFSSVFPERFSATFLAASMLLFAFSSMLSFSLYGERCASYLGGTMLSKTYFILFVLSIVISSRFPSAAAWRMADCLNILLAVPNLIALFLLSKRQGLLLKE